MSQEPVEDWAINRCLNKIDDSIHLYSMTGDWHHLISGLEYYKQLVELAKKAPVGDDE